MKYCGSCGHEAQNAMTMCAQCGNRSFSDSPSSQFSQKAPYGSETVQNTLENPVATDTQPPQLSGRGTVSDGSNIVPAGWLENPPTPWRRYAARILDLSFFGVIGFIVISIIFYSVAPYSAENFFMLFNNPSAQIFDLILTVFVGSILTGSIVGVSGFSLGKILFGIVVTDYNGKKIGLVNGVLRDLEIYIKGLALGIPIVSLFTLYASYKNLTTTKATTWDQAKNYKVWHRPSGVAQYLLNVIGVVILLIITTTVRLLDQI